MNKPNLTIPIDCEGVLDLQDDIIYIRVCIREKNSTYGICKICKMGGIIRLTKEKLMYMHEASPFVHLPVDLDIIPDEDDD